MQNEEGDISSERPYQENSKHLNIYHQEMSEPSINFADPEAVDQLQTDRASQNGQFLNSYLKVNTNLNPYE
jgi:hypothetical protein